MPNGRSRARSPSAISGIRAPDTSVNPEPFDELEAFDYETYKKNGFKVEHLGDYPLSLETKDDLRFQLRGDE